MNLNGPKAYFQKTMKFFMMSSPQTYRLLCSIQGHQGPINCFAVIGDCELLASGGDDETVKLWDLATYHQRATIADKAHRWGQITCLLWIPLDKPFPGGGLLCFGTGRGRMIVYKRQKKKDRFIEGSDVQIFSVGNSFETIAFDPINFRVVATSHHGQIKMLRLEKEDMSPLWTVDINEAIPRSAHFINRGQDILVYALETGEIFCWDAQTAALKHSKTLKTPIGNIGVDETERNVVVDNIKTGFDVYPIHRATPIHSFEIPTTKTYVRMVVFGQKGSIVVGGSDHGKVYICSLKAPQTVETVKHGGSMSLIQAIAITSSEDRHLIFSGSSDEKSSICIWERPTKRALQKRRREDERRGEVGLIWILLVIVFFTSKYWYPPLKEELVVWSTKLQGVMDNIVTVSTHKLMSTRGSNVKLSDETLLAIFKAGGPTKDMEAIKEELIKRGFPLIEI